MQTAETGAVSELDAMTQFVRRGFTVSIPFTLARFDFIATKGEQHIRVQVKTGTTFNGGREILGFSQKPYTKDDIDVVVMVAHTGTFYYVPVEKVEGMTSIRLRLTPYLYNVKEEKALLADDFLTFYF